LPSVDDELDEIKKLIKDDNGGADSPSPRDLVPARPEPSGIAAPKKPEAKGISVPSAPQTPGPVRPGSGSPAVPPSPQQRAPATQKRVPPPNAAKSAGQVRAYDISPDGKITKRPDQKQEQDRKQEPGKGSGKFNVNFDFDGEYKDIPEKRPLRVRREKRTGCIGGAMYAAFVICVSLILASLIWMAAVDVLGLGSENATVNVAVREGFEINEITDMLYDAGLIRYKFLFNLYAGYSNAEDKITAGQYVLNKNYDYRAIVQGMTARAGVRVETTVTIPEGYTLAQIFNLLEDYGVVKSANDLWETAANYNFNFHFLDEETLGDRLRLEGFLFPETYNFYIDSTPVQVLNKLLREFNRRFTDTHIERANQMGFSVRDIINVAAMIEREAGSDEERPRIAAVIYNRLASRDFPRLEIDATIYYAIAGTNRQFSTDLDSPYNTYIHSGLPPGPIANPGMSSIRAALYPDSTNEYYYALNKDGTHDFFRTFSQHQAFVNGPNYGG